MKNIKEKIKGYTIRFDEDHTMIRYIQRCIPPDELQTIIQQWDIIETDVDGSYLLWGILEDKRIVHISCYPDFETKTIWVKTEYIPDDKYFTAESNYRERVRYKK
ncbi:MAG TPA: hypothetical protein VMZ29_15465 [Candidatus Bathyarchaeia archaeon]|nr:hypothetical protein [Candidatus Bathyarchaeia archaeon]